ncbi:transcriptional regulator [Rhizobium sp. ACO-34A]|nr:metalloregulator ArsR/SmtB family transcription factor [Rhizobium sp. ACO-34A]ATN34963.1 transcriptional regulator [Rhizobium sp. ACO-34A]
MNQSEALVIFAALSQETRLRIVRTLVVVGAVGMAAGALAEKVEVSPSNLSFHLKELERAGLVTPQRESRSIAYRTNNERLGDLLRFLMEDCCGGQPDICASAFAVAQCCGPDKVVS